jgi:hypothetical protein
VVGDRELTIVDSDRPTASPGNAHETLTQSRDRSDSMGNSVSNELRIKMLARVQHQDRTDLHRGGPSLRGKGQQIVRTDPLSAVERHLRATGSALGPCWRRRVTGSSWSASSALR